MEVRLKIKELLKLEGRNIIWLAGKLDLTPNHLRIVLRGDRALSNDNLKKIEALFPELKYTIQESLKEKPFWKDDKDSEVR